MGFMRAVRFRNQSYTDLLLNRVPPETTPALLSVLQHLHTYASNVFARDSQHKIISGELHAERIN